MKNEYFYEKNIDENNYSIQEEGWLGILFLVGTIFFSGLLLYGFIDGQADFSVIVAYGILIAFSGICTLHLFLWRVKVNHDVIEYRSFFRRKNETRQHDMVLYLIEEMQNKELVIV